MKRTVISLCVFMVIGLSISAAPGDVLVDKIAAIWRIATWTTTYPDGLIDRLMDNMKLVSNDYTSAHDIQEWATWLKFDIATQFSGKIYPNEVYATILYALVEKSYNYGDPRLQESKAPPVCTVGTGEITCDEDPTGAARDVLLWRFVSNEFVEQDPTGVGYTITLDTGTWTIGPLPSGIANVCVAYDDGFTSFPTLFMTTQ